MKILSEEPNYKPITLTITLETQKEAYDFYNIFNTVEVTSSLHTNIGIEIFNHLFKNHQELSHNSQYTSFKEQLDEKYIKD